MALISEKERIAAAETAVAEAADPDQGIGLENTKFKDRLKQKFKQGVEEFKKDPAGKTSAALGQLNSGLEEQFKAAKQRRQAADQAADAVPHVNLSDVYNRR